MQPASAITSHGAQQDSDSPHSRTVAATVDRWWTEIDAFIATGHHNAKSEGSDRVIKLVTRNAFGFHNAVTARRAREHLRTAQLWRPGRPAAAYWSALTEAISSR